jgi:hypothetical protein
VQRDTTRLMRAVLTRLSDGEVSDDQLEQLVSTATTELDDDQESPFWQVVDRVAQLRSMGEQELTLVAAILEVVASHSAGARRGR